MAIRNFCGVSLSLPVLHAADSGELGLALSNPTLTAVTVPLKARYYAGVSIAGSGIAIPATLTLPASGQLALRVSGNVGWVIN